MRIKSEYVTINIDLGTMLLIAEILRIERNAEKRDSKAAEAAVVQAAKSLRTGFN